jgi:uridine kinase
VWAPEKSFSDATFQPIVKSFVVDKQSTDARTKIYVQKINDMSEASMRAIRQMGDEAMRRSKAQFNAFNQAQEMRQRQHEQFLASMQRGTDMSMARATEARMRGIRRRMIGAITRSTSRSGSIRGRAKLPRIRARTAIRG